MAERKRTLDLDPVSPLFNGGLAYQFYSARRFDEAIEQARKTLELDPSHPHVHFELGLTYAAKGMYGDALAEFEKLPPSGRRDVYLAYTLARMGERRQALRILDKLKAASAQESAPGSRSLAIIHIGLGEKDQAFALLEKAYGERSFLLPYLKVDPIWDPLSSDPRFADLVRRIGLPPEPRKRPQLCPPCDGESSTAWTVF